MESAAADNGDTADDNPCCTVPASKLKKKKILNAVDYARICDFIRCYPGLAIDCELKMVNEVFTDIERFTLKCILQNQLNVRLRKINWRYEKNGKKLLMQFEEQCVTYKQNDLLLKMALAEGISPIALCRAVLHQKLKSENNKYKLSDYIRYPHLIKDTRLSANVIQCLCSDNQDGPLVDLTRRILGEEYEMKLKQLAKVAGMHYYDEKDLRRMGYDKTPDLKMKLPFLYKGQVVNWIESKANFGDVKSHKYNVQQQLSCYNNRFGPGIIIYWFGYQEETPHLPENGTGIIVLDDFPASEDLVFLDLTTNDSDDKRLKPQDSS